MRGDLVDQPKTAPAQAIQLRGAVAHLVGDVVQAGAAGGEELAHGRVVAERHEQLDMALAHLDEHRLDALLGHDLAVLDGQPSCSS